LGVRRMCGGFATSFFFPLFKKERIRFLLGGAIACTDFFFTATPGTGFFLANQGNVTGLRFLSLPCFPDLCKCAKGGKNGPALHWFLSCLLAPDEIPQAWLGHHFYSTEARGREGRQPVSSPPSPAGLAGYS